MKKVIVIKINKWMSTAMIVMNGKKNKILTLIFMIRVLKSTKKVMN